MGNATDSSSALTIIEVEVVLSNIPRSTVTFTTWLRPAFRLPDVGETVTHDSNPDMFQLVVLSPVFVSVKVNDRVSFPKRSDETDSSSFESPL